MPVVPESDHPRFRLVRESEFGREHLDEYPVWSEFYDFEERDKIVSWGIDATWLDAELARIQSGNEHAVYPLLEVNPFPPRMRIFIRARFRTVGGQRVGGYIVNEDAVPAIGVFYGGRELGFNRHMGAWTEHVAEREALRASLPEPADPVFPLTYETEFTDIRGHPIAGTFDFDPD